MRKIATVSAMVLLPAVLGGCNPTPDTDHMKTSTAVTTTTATVAAAMTAPSSGGTIDCAGPVTVNMSAKALLARFGKDAKSGDIAGPEGQTAKGIILYPDDPARKLEVMYWDDAQTAVSNVALGEKATAWTAPGGLKLGAALGEVQAANGAPFELSGFDWDYGGYVSNLKDGKLAKLPGGCTLGVRFDLPSNAGNVPDALMGDRVLVSTNAELQKAAPHVVELSLEWPLPKGVKASGDAGGE